MPYQIQRHSDTLVRVTMHGHMGLEQAEVYCSEIWALLDSCPRPTDLLVDGRRMQGANYRARQRTDQIAHHPHLGHIAFVVGTHHLLLFAPLVKLVSGIGMFGNEEEALAFLRSARGLPTVPSQNLPIAPPHPQPRPLATPQNEARPDLALPSRPLPPPPAPRARPTPPRPEPTHGVLRRITGLVDGWADPSHRQGDSSEQ